jgi:hypothetical protein
MLPSALSADSRSLKTMLLSLHKHRYISLANELPAELYGPSVTRRSFSFAVKEPLLVMVVSWAWLTRVDLAFVALGSETVGMPFPVAPGDDNMTASVPVVIVRLLML